MKAAVFFILFFVSSISGFCGQWDTQVVGPYTLFNNLWGIVGSTGSQCTSVTSSSSNTIAWTATWTWNGGGNGVKSYPNAGLQTVNKKLSAISTIPSTWNWSYKLSGSYVANVAYDIWTSNTAGGADKYEIMIWLGKWGGAGPISSTYGANGQPIVIDSTTIASVTFNFYKGAILDNYGQEMWKVYSFVATSNKQTFTADLKLFFTWLINKGHISRDQYLTKLQAGTEPTQGSGTFTVSKYSVQVN